MQISNNLGLNGGWTLTVKQEGQFANATAQHKELTGSQIKFVNPTVTGKTEGVPPPSAAKEITLVPKGAESLVMSAQSAEGAGLWGTVDEMTKVEGKKVQKKQSYFPYYSRGNVKWNISDVPVNNN